MFSAPTGNLYISHSGGATAGDGGADTTRGLSPRLWSDIKVANPSTDGNNAGSFYGDDFELMQGTGIVAGAALTYPTVTGLSLSGYRCYASIGASLTRVTGEPGGIIKFEAGDTADDSMIISTGELVALSDSGGSNNKKTVFETRIKLTTIVQGSVFVGLGSQVMVADGGLIASGGAPIATAAAIGFNVDEGDVDGIDFIYQAANTADVRHINPVKVAVADTWYKLGFVFDPAAPDSKKIKVYVDNVEQTTYVTDALMAVAAFPEDEYMGFVAAAMSGDTPADNNLEIDWWALYQAHS